MSRLIKSLLVATVLLALLTPVAQAADPFYERLLQKGKRSLTVDPESAAEDLRLACFGMLDDPEELVDCQVHLAVAQGNLGDTTGFEETFTRLLDTEIRFPTYQNLSLDPLVRQSFESQLETSVAYEALIQAPAFRQIAARVFEDRLASLPLEQRRQELAALRAREPAELRWLIMMSEVELESGGTDATNEALEMAEAALRRDSELLRAICVRGRALAVLNRCSEALEDLMSCDQDSPERNTEVTLARLRCRVATSGWSEAQALLGQLTAEGVNTSETRRLSREVRRGLRTAPPPAPPQDDEGDAPADPEAASSGTP